PVEAQAAGCPVIALGKGGALETVVDQSTGLFFHAASVEALVDAVRRFESAPMAADDCREQARGFSAIRFRRSVAGFLDELT
ncbi:glycosyltransferase family 4 protein, partial [bacterium]